MATSSSRSATTRHIFLMHGLCHGGWCWYKVAARLRSMAPAGLSYRVVAPDLAAAGVDSRRLDEVPTFRDYTAPLLDALRSLPDGEKAVLVGHSFGGLSIALAADEFQVKVAAVVFLCAFMPDCTSPPSHVIEEETIKTAYTTRDLDSLSRGRNWQWSWVPSRGHSGGMLIGTDKDFAEVQQEGEGEFFQYICIENVEDNFCWELINVYGPVQEDRKRDFLEELLTRIKASQLPLLVGGDFNLVRRIEDKSSGNVNVQLMEVFNEMIEESEMMELRRGGSRYTWTNKQLEPIQCVLDRVFVNNSWEDKFPLVRVQALTRIGSDHNPIVVDTGGRQKEKPNYFRFDPSWLTQGSFKQWVLEKWPQRFKHNCLDHWHVMSGKLRKAMKGWGVNFESAMRKRKQQIVKTIKEFDEVADQRVMDTQEWAQRYELEKELQGIYEAEEIYWQKRGGEKWVLKGDSNSGYFHKCASIRKRKLAIVSLEDGDRWISESEDLKAHITGYYKNLFGAEDRINIQLEENLWEQYQKVTVEENEMLVEPFTLEEVEAAVKEIKNNTAPGPDGFSIEFFKEFWPKIKGDILEMLEDLHAGRLDLWRLNYGVIILLPKLKLPNNIKQFRPICLLNVIFKIITKVLTLRLTRVAGRIISRNQTAFIPGRNILDGIVIVQEVLHELKSRRKKGVILKLDFEKAYDRVNWNFLEEVLIKKGFSEVWIRWVMQAVTGGRVAVDINGERGEFFRSYKGLRQGDPLSPLLFNFVGDAFSAMVDAANRSGDIKGLIPHLVEEGLTHLQHADDTVIFLDIEESNLLHMKFILYCYEAISGMKINYSKSEVYVVGVDDSKKVEVAKLFGCKVGVLPMIYLGVPVSDQKLTKAQLSYIEAKARSKLGSWKGDTMSSGGKSILINSCLSNAPLYTMGVYMLYEGNYQALDSIRSKFFWQGTNKKRKYHMVSWEALSRPKEYGGLGFMDIRVMNICLLGKWLERLEKGDDSICVELLKRKYLGDNSIFQLTGKGGSQFWRGLLATKQWYQWGRKVKVNSGRQTRFWQDLWIGNCALKIEFDQLYKYCRDTEISVAEAYTNGRWQIQFRRSLSAEEYVEWERLMGWLSEVEITDGRDESSWILEKSGKYTTKSLYKVMKFGGVKDIAMMEVWKCKIPLKVQIFMWMAFRDRIQSAEQLKKRKWKGQVECKLCGGLETTDHILFQCPVAVFLWVYIREALNWPYAPTSCYKLVELVMSQKRSRTEPKPMFICAGVMWVLWKTRNNLVFNNKLIASPAITVHKTAALLSQWKPLLKEEERGKVELLIQELEDGVRC